MTENYSVWVNNHNAQWLAENCDSPLMVVLMGQSRMSAFVFVQRMREVDGDRFFVRNDATDQWVTVPRSWGDDDVSHDVRAEVVQWVLMLNENERQK